jgi:cysteine desulfurase/selenocysteine lyase
MIYLNYAATSGVKPDVVLGAISAFYKKGNIASPSRSTDSRNIEMTIVENCREKIAALFKIKDKRKIIYCSNATHALNLAIQGILKKNDHVVTTIYEHNSVLRPLTKMKNERGIEISIVSPGSDGIITPESIDKNIISKTKLVVINHASNVTGIVQPIKEIGEVVRARNKILLVDAAQSAGLIDIDVNRDNIDLLAFTGHKSLYGPTGIGGLYFSDRVSILPLLVGGTGTFSEMDIQPEILPDKYEAGTPNLLGMEGLSAGIGFVLEKSVEKILKHELKLRDQLIEGLRQIQSVKIVGYHPKTLSTPVLSIVFGNTNSNEIGDVLDRSFDIIVRSGLHCAPYIHKYLGTLESGTIRFSIGYFNNEKEISTVIDSLKKIERSIVTS